MIKYPSLIHEKEIRDWKDDTRRWMVFEKMHGCNFSMRVRGKEVEAYRRNGKLAPGEKFYGWESHKARYADALLNLSGLFGGDICLFGELVGGFYPGGKRNTPVQKYIYYCASYEWIIFDVYAVSEDRFLGYDEFASALEREGLLVAKPWYRDATLDEILQMERESEITRVPALFGLEPVAGNTIEGWVLRPEDGLEPHGIKLRTKRFRDRAHREDVPVLPPAEKPEVDDALLDLVSQARFENVRSKEQEIQSRSEIPRYIDLLVEDILQEQGGEASEDARKALRKKAGRLVVAEFNAILPH